MPTNRRAVYDGKYHASPECWSLFTEVLGVEFGNAVVLGLVHQSTVDAYAVQHAGGDHPDKSVVIHLCGLHLVQELGWPGPRVPKVLQHLAATVNTWPHFPPPHDQGSLTVFDVALCDSPETHVETVHRWSAQVWHAWSVYHADVASFLSKHAAVK